MSKVAIDFLENSFLFDSRCEKEEYSRFSDDDIVKELEKYRNHIQNELSNAVSTIDKSKAHINTVIDSFGSMPNMSDYKKMALYLNQVIVPDPLFRFAEGKNNSSEAFNTFMGLNPSSAIDRKDLIEIVQYFKRISLLIKSGFVVTLPLSQLHEQGETIPITASKTGFYDELPKEIIDFYRSSAHVCNITKQHDNYVIDYKSPLHTGTCIKVFFGDPSDNAGSCFQYMNAKCIGDDGNGKLILRNTIPESMDEHTFKVWVDQSINQAGIHHFQERSAELFFANHIGCMYSTNSSFTANMLNCVLIEDNKGKRASAALKMDLPVFYELPLEDIIEIRSNYGSAFERFRNDLNKKLSELDDISDKELFLRKIHEIEQELFETSIKSVDDERRKIKHFLKWDTAVAIGTLAANYTLGGLTVVGVIGAVANGVKDLAKYSAEIKEHNGFFLWKLKERADKYSV